MRSSVLLLYALMILHGGTGSAQSDRISGDLVINIFESDKSSNIEQRLASLLTRELRLQNQETEPAIIFFEGSPSDLAGWLTDKSFAYVARFEVAGNWVTHRRIAFPFFLNLYQRSYKLQVFAYIFDGNNNEPFLVRIYEIKIGGPNVWQILENNPCDGDLALSSGERLEIESKAEGKMIRKMADDLQPLLKRMGGS